MSTYCREAQGGALGSPDALATTVRVGQAASVDGSLVAARTQGGAR